MIIHLFQRNYVHFQEPQCKFRILPFLRRILLLQNINLCSVLPLYSLRMINNKNSGTVSIYTVDSKTSSSSLEFRCPTIEKACKCQHITVHTVTLSSPSTIISCVEKVPQGETSSNITVADSEHGHPKSYDESTTSTVLRDVHIVRTLELNAFIYLFIFISLFCFLLILCYLYFVVTPYLCRIISLSLMLLSLPETISSFSVFNFPELLQAHAFSMIMSALGIMWLIGDYYICVSRQG